MTFPLDVVENISDLGYDIDDEVFVEDDEVQLRPKERGTPAPRIRRVSDVIDSIGEGSPVHRNLIEAMENDRRMSDPPKQAVPTTFAGPQRHSDSFITNGRSKSICDDGYGSCSTVIPQAEDMKFSKEDFTKKLVSDTVDARPEPHDQLDAQAFLSPPCQATPEARMPVARESEEYNMNHVRRGRAVIFNHDIFTLQGISPRSGSGADAQYLRDTFDLLGFEVDICENYTRAQLIDYVKQLSQEDFTDADCLCIAVLTHGIGTNFLLANDMPYMFEELWAPFTGDKCLTLAGKPKLFFIQACRGDKLDPGVNLVNNSAPRTETDSGSPSYKIPSRADFLFAYSSVEGYYSWRNPENGTWFIQCLCEELQKYGNRLELRDILTRVQRKVALDHESFNDLIPWQHQQKQIPSVVSMLIRDLYFKPKPK